MQSLPIQRNRRCSWTIVAATLVGDIHVEMIAEVVSVLAVMEVLEILPRRYLDI